MNNINELRRYLETDSVVMDESLEEHDRKYHPQGYSEGDSCKFRDAQSKSDNADNLGGNKEKQDDELLSYEEYKGLVEGLVAQMNPENEDAIEPLIAKLEKQFPEYVNRQMEEWYDEEFDDFMDNVWDAVDDDGSVDAATFAKIENEVRQRWNEARESGADMGKLEDDIARELDSKYGAGSSYSEDAAPKHYLNMIAQDTGTHEGAVKAAQTRKLGTGGVDHQMFLKRMAARRKKEAAEAMRRSAWEAKLDRHDAWRMPHY